MVLAGFSMRGRARRAGFTLVELLVVIAIIGILVALLLPAIQAARESARRTQCTNNLKQLSLAMIQHNDAHGFLPTAGWWGSWLGDPDRGFEKRQPGGWIYNILPFIEQQSIRDMGAGLANNPRWAAYQKRDAMTISYLNCPSRRPSIPYPNSVPQTPANGRQSQVHARSDYAANAGDIEELEEICRSVIPTSYPNADNGTNPKWPPNPLDDDFKYKDGTPKLNGTAFCGGTVKFTSITDGLSKTYVIGERHIDPDHYETGLEHGDDWSMWSGYQDDNCRSTFYDAARDINRIPIQDTPGFEDKQRFGSAHPGGCNMAFGDGSVQLISYDIEAEVHRRNGNRMDNGQPLDGAVPRN